MCPSAETLLNTLDALALKPSGFDGAVDNDGSHESRVAVSDGLPRYLTSIVSNALDWIEDESTREKIWETASERLSERSGRTAMPSIDRTFYVPISVVPSSAKIPIILREPSLTADNLGHKTWGASYLLAKRLPLLSQYLPVLQRRGLCGRAHHPAQESKTAHDGGGISSPRVLELGAGTGLVGIAAAATFGAGVDLTDLPGICENLTYNALCNQEVITSHGGSLTAFPLDWSDLPSAGSVRGQQYDVIMAADPLYSPEHPVMLADTIAVYLVAKSSSRVVVELPLREAYQPEVDRFRDTMKGKGLTIITEGEEVGYDDWGNGAQEVRCWWGIWAWGDWLTEGGTECATGHAIIG
ncbi:hypothetical protein MMC26_007001 [Xylographa opegraphella]|nr:hypothetical protein [Xylographa opegraphella]